MRSVRKRVLVAHPFVAPNGGASGVAAWTLMALREQCDVTLASLRPPGLALINRMFGTSLRESDFSLRLAPPRHLALIEAFPFRGALLEISLTTRLARTIDAARPFDVLIGTQDECDFGRRGIQYVHHPWMYLPRPAHEMRWFHSIPGVLSGYRRFCLNLALGRVEGLRRNLTLANSRFVAERIRQTHGIDSIVVPPPVPGDFPPIPWSERTNGFVALGRMDGCKRWPMAVAILDEVRRRGHDVSLTLLGSRDQQGALEEIQALSATRPWFRIQCDRSRVELTAEIARHRYGIHTMADEHFGIAPAELQRAGCLVFVHNSGGPVDIVGGDPRLLFDDVHQAAERIDRVLSSAALQSSLREHVARQRDRFSTEQFCETMRRIVEEFDGASLR